MLLCLSEFPDVLRLQDENMVRTPGRARHVGHGQVLPGCAQVIQHVSGGVLPARLAFAGYAEGGALAKLAAVWGAAAHPNAQARCITFGAPRVGDARCVRFTLSAARCPPPLRSRHERALCEPL